MNECSNKIDYEGFSRDFSADLKEFLTEERFVEQCKKHQLLTTLVLGAEPIACLRRKEGVGVVFKQLSSQLEGNLVISDANGNVEVVDATIY